MTLMGEAVRFTPLASLQKIKTRLREEQLREIQSVLVVVVASSEQKNGSCHMNVQPFPLEL